MFDTYVVDRSVHPRARWLLSGAILAVALLAAGVAGLTLYSYWNIERLTPAYREVRFLSIPPPPEPAAAAAAPLPLKVPDRPVRPRVDRDLPVIQPTDKQEPEKVDDTTDQTDPGQADGRADGVAGGTDPDGSGTNIHGIKGGIPNGTGVLPLPPGNCTGDDCGGIIIKKKPEVVDMKAIEGHRTAGREQIPLPRDAKIRATQNGNRNLLVVVKLCLDASGAPSQIELQKSSGYPEADQAILTEMRDWRYRPYRVNDEAVPVCTGVVFKYVIED